MEVAIDPAPNAAGVAKALVRPLARSSGLAVIAAATPPVGPTSSALALTPRRLAAPLSTRLTALDKTPPALDKAPPPAAVVAPLPISECASTAWAGPFTAFTRV